MSLPDSPTRLGGWCHIDSGYALEIMASAGFDWCCLDTQHGLADRIGLVAALQALQVGGCPAYVRVPAGAPDRIAAALDAGARGVIVPQVSSAAAAREAVAECRYAPAGHRSWGPLRAKLRPQPPGPADLDATADCLVMIEDREGLDALDAIAAVPGLTGILVGPADLALSLWGDPGLASDERTLTVAAHIAAACRAHGLVPAVFAGGADHVGRWCAAGFAMVAVDSDSTLLLRAARAAVRTAREL